MRPEDLKQGSAEWLQVRVGKATGSNIWKAIDFLKNGKPSMARTKYMYDLLAERLTGYAVDHYVSPEMDWGTDNEKYARAAYEVVSGSDVDLVGFCPHPTILGSGASPDGLVGLDGCVEFKCPKTCNHLMWMDAGEVPEEHVPQCIWQMVCTQRAWCDFVSFDPRLHPRDQVFIKRLEWNQEYVDLMEEGVRRFLSELEAMVARRGGPREPIEAPEPQEDPLGITDEDIAWGRSRQEAQ